MKSERSDGDDGRPQPPWPLTWSKASDKGVPTDKRTLRFVSNTKENEQKQYNEERADETLQSPQAELGVPLQHKAR